MNYLKKIFLVIISIFITLAVGEGYLLITGKYSNLINSGLKQSNAVWDKRPNYQFNQVHPDLKIDVVNISGNLGVRNHTKKSLKEFENIIGFFGDSFTENRRVEDRFTFTTILNRFWNQNRAVNFGVDGYGLEQSYQRWRNYKDKIKIKDVVYVFCRNDLRGLYEIELFKLQKNGDKIDLINRQDIEKNLSLSEHLRYYLGKIRLSYLLIDAYYTLTSKEFKNDHLSTVLNVNKNNSFVIGSDDAYASEIDHSIAINKIKPETVQLQKKFMLILNSWQQEVLDSGASFHMIILPRYLDLKVFENMYQYKTKSIDSLMLSKISREKLFNDYSYFFKNDPHFNEMGNLMTFKAFVSYFSPHESGHQLEEFTSIKFQEILDYYQLHGSYPNKSKRLPGSLSN